MARKQKHTEWENNYVEKLKFLKELYDERKAFIDSYNAAFQDEDTSNGGGQVSSSGSSDAASITAGNSYEEKAWNFFAEKGFTAAACAGILANLKQESGVDPTKKQYGGGPGRGLCQWEEGGRWDSLLKWAKDKDPWAIETQLDFLWEELNGKDPTTKSILDKRYGGIEALKSATDHKWACLAFEDSFERAGKPNMERRYKYAKEYLDRFGAGSSSGAASIVGDVSGKAKLVLEHADKWLSKPNVYVLGSGRNDSDVKAGRFDCSSFVWHVFNEAGIQLGKRDSATTKTFIKMGKSVSTDELQPGDLAFFDSYGAPPGHVTIYIGGGKCIGSQSSGIGVFDMKGVYWGDVIHKEHRRVIT